MEINITGKLPAQLPLSQTSKNAMFFFLSFISFLLQNQGTGGQNRCCVDGGGQFAPVGGRGAGKNGIGG
jgi:hypothetical protein